MADLKVGDIVERVSGGEYGGIYEGDEGEVINTIDSSIHIWYNNTKGHGNGLYGHNRDNLKLVRSAPKSSGRPKKQKPIVKHMVIQESCNNHICTCDSYKEAISKRPDGDEVYNVYELVHVAKVENAPKVTRIRKVNVKVNAKAIAKKKA